MHDAALRVMEHGFAIVTVDDVRSAWQGKAAVEVDTGEDNPGEYLRRRAAGQFLPGQKGTVRAEVRSDAGPDARSMMRRRPIAALAQRSKEVRATVPALATRPFIATSEFSAVHGPARLDRDRRDCLSRCRPAHPILTKR